MKHLLCCLLALCAVAAWTPAARGEDIPDDKYVGKSMKDMRGQEFPELVSEKSDWLNVDAPLTMAGLLKDKRLVYIEFGFLA